VLLRPWFLSFIRFRVSSRNIESHNAAPFAFGFSTSVFAFSIARRNMLSVIDLISAGR
jgi:hypothetical protein